MAINLLPENLQTHQRRGQQQKVASIVSITLLVTLLVGVVVTFSYRVYVTRQQEALTAEYQSLKQGVGNLKNTEGLLKSVQAKLRRVKTYTNPKLPYIQIIQDVDTAAINRVTLESLDLGTQEVIPVSGSTDSLVKLSEFISLLDTKDKPYQNFTVKSLSLDSRDFRYRFTITFEYHATKKP